MKTSKATQDAAIMLFRILSLSLFALTTFSSAATPVLLDQVVAFVDDEVIMESSLTQRIQQIKNQNTNNQLPNEAALRKQVLKSMIIDSIQLQMADRGNIIISDAQLNETFIRIAEQNGMTLSQFRQTMEAEETPFAIAREQILNEMRISRVQRSMVGERIQITDQDIDYFLASEIGKMASAAEYHLGHILIATPANATPADINAAEKKANEIVKKLRQGADFRQMAMAESNSRTALEGGDLGWRKEAQLPSLFANTVPNMQLDAVSDAISSSSGFHIIKLLGKRGGNTKLVTQYKARHILISPNELRTDKDREVLINELYHRLKAGEDFSILAREYSDDPGSAASGGDLGWVNIGDMVPEFNNTMLETPINHINAPFESQFGWHILEVQDTRETDVGVENQRNQVRNLLYGRRFEEELPIWLRKIRAESYVEIKELD